LSWITILRKRDNFRRAFNDFFRIEIVKRTAEIVAFAQDRDPRQPGLESVEDQLFEEGAVVVLRHAPFLVVVGDVQGVLLRPRAAAQSVGLAHETAFASPGQSNFAQDGFTGRTGTPPASSIVFAARASAIRSSRIGARPRTFAVEPSVPTCLSPAMIGRPELGANSS